MARIYLVLPIIIALSYNGLIADCIAAVLFLLASISDYYDGYFARKYNAVSTMGKFMDPIADKVLVTSVLMVMLPLGKVDPFMVIILSARDTFIGGIRSIAAADNLIIAARATGKWKTAIQMGAIPTLMVGEYIPFFYSLEKIAYLVLWLSVGFSLISGWEYFVAYRSAKVTIQ